MTLTCQITFDPYQLKKFNVNSDTLKSVIITIKIEVRDNMLSLQNNPNSAFLVT